MWNPSFDFRLFELPQFSPLQAQEFGAETIFGAADPPWFVDRSIGELFGLGDLALFQGESAEAIRERLRRTRDEADRLLREAGGSAPAQAPASKCGTTKCHWYERWAGKKDGECCHDVLTSDDSSVGTISPSGDRVGSGLKEWLEALPSGSGVFLVAVLAIIFLLLFARR